jgi:hypothetical protein
MEISLSPLRCNRYGSASPRAELPPRDVDDGGTEPTMLTSAVESATSTPLVAPRRWDLGGARRQYPWWRRWEDPISGRGGILAATSVLMASVAMEVHDSDNGGPDVDAGWWNPDGGGVILTAHLRNPRRGVGVGI